MDTKSGIVWCWLATAACSRWMAIWRSRARTIHNSTFNIYIYFFLFYFFFYRPQCSLFIVSLWVRCVCVHSYFPSLPSSSSSSAIIFCHISNIYIDSYECILHKHNNNLNENVIIKISKNLYRYIPLWSRFPSFSRYFFVINSVSVRRHISITGILYCCAVSLFCHFCEEKKKREEKHEKFIANHLEYAILKFRIDVHARIVRIFHFVFFFFCIFFHVPLLMRVIFIY